MFHGLMKPFLFITDTPMDTQKADSKKEKVEKLTSYC